MKHYEMPLKLCLEMRPMDDPPAVLHTDPAPGFKALVNDPLLNQHRSTIELGQAKNPSKNPIAEKAIQEWEQNYYIRSLFNFPLAQA